MKIGFFTDTYLPVIHGVEVSIETFRKSLEKRGHKVFIYAPYAPGYKDKNKNVFRFRSIKVIKKPEMRFALPFLPKDHFDKIMNLKLDIVHSHTPFSMGLLAKYVADHQKIPLIYTHHTHYPEYAKFYLKEKIITPLLARFLSGWYSNMADAVIAPSFKIKKLLAEYGVKKTKPIYVLPTGVNINLFKKSAKRSFFVRRKFLIFPRAKVLIFVGRMGREKNLEFLLKSFSEVVKSAGDVFLLMVGDGPFLKELRELAGDLGIERNVVFTGAVPHKEIPDYYKAADVFVFSSKTETQGIVILEAMASGLPVVALKDEAFREIVIDGKNGFLVKSRKAKIFANKILNSFAFHGEFSKNSRETACEFSEEKQAEKLLGIYKDSMKSYGIR